MPLMPENACSECVCFYSGQGRDDAHGHFLQRGAPTTVGALGDALQWMKTSAL
jgi:hypothetical protein